jgi:phenylacetate-CoA ligase
MLLDQIGVAPRDIQRVSDLKRLPILTKETLRTEYRALMTSAPRAGWLEGHTSGTTGSPVTLWYDRATCVLNNAVDWRQKVWAGMGSDDWIGLFLGRVIVPITQTRAPYWRVNRALRQVWFSSFHLSEDNLPQMITEIERRRLRFLEGYPSTLYVMANFLRRRGRTLPMTAVMSSSETLLPLQRETIEDAFQCELFDFYGMAERVAFAGECELHSGKHVSEEYGILEIVDADGNRVPPGQKGYIVGTSLHNVAMPMIRYRMNDVSAEIVQPCSCGRTLRRIEDVATKAEDIVVTPDGRWISPSVLTHPFKPLHQVEKSQVIQDELDHITVRVVPHGEFTTEERDALSSGLLERLGDQMRLDIEVVDDIPRESSGKFRWVVSKVNHVHQVAWD